MTIYAALHSVGLSVADLPAMRAEVLAAIKAANADLLAGWRS